MKLTLIFVSLIFTLSCGGGKKGLEAFNNITKATMSSVPMMIESKGIDSSSFKTTDKNLSTSDLGFTTTIENEHKNFIQGFFKLECHMNSKKSNFCPENLNPKPEYNKKGVNDQYKLTISTLIGLVYHAIMYGENIYSGSGYKTCQKGDNASSLVNNTPYYDGNAIHDLVINIPDFFDCVSDFTYAGSKVYSTYHKAENDDLFGVITSRYNVGQEGTPVTYSSDIFQIYASQVEDGFPKLIAANLAAYNTMLNRAIIIADISYNKFVAKYHTKQNNKSHLLNAIGQAGVDSQGNWVKGNYVVRTNIEGDIKTFCMENGETPTILAGSECSDLENIIGNWSNIDLKAYFDLSDEDDERLANFINKLNTDTAFSENEIPSNHNSFPQTITASE